MPFRERVRRVLGRGSSVSDGASLKHSKTADSSSGKHTVYQPGEPLPKPKYRGPVDPQHKERLEGFSWGHGVNIRRPSCHSQYSPFGSRMPSRNHSLDGSEPWALHLDTRARHGKAARPKTGMNRVGQVAENADDDGDISNVGGTRNHSVSEPTSSVPSDSSVESRYLPDDDDDDTAAGLRGFARDHRPFTEADVTNALEKSLSKRSHE